MQRYAIYVNMHRKGLKKVCSGGPDDLNTLISILLPAVATKWPNVWVMLVDHSKMGSRNQVGAVIREICPAGHTLKIQRDKEQYEKEGLRNRYGERHLPTICSRPGKGDINPHQVYGVKAKKKKWAVQDKLDFNDLRKNDHLK
jgi:hypothetical protein